MILRRCGNCGETFLVPRVRCPKCFGENFDEVVVNEGVVSDCIEIITTPDPYPERYFLVLAKTVAGVSVFCRSDREIARGSTVVIKDLELGPVCRKA